MYVYIIFKKIIIQDIQQLIDLIDENFYIQKINLSGNCKKQI